MSATDRLSLVQFEHLSLSEAAAAQFTIALEELRALKLSDRLENPVALYLGDIADARDREELICAKSLGIGFVHGLSVAKGITESEAEALRQVFHNAADRATSS